jgi:hypothetical protein
LYHSSYFSACLSHFVLVSVFSFFMFLFALFAYWLWALISFRE